MTTTLKFRNIDTSPDDPVETWPFEGILAAVERGALPDWRRLAAAIRADPWGPVVSFTDVRVPVANLLGEENRGFYHLMGNLPARAAGHLGQRGGTGPARA